MISKDLNIFMVSEDLMSMETEYTQYVHCDVAGTPDLATKVVSPLLTADAKDLLLNCLTSKEADLWTSLGDAWTISRLLLTVAGLAIACSWLVCSRDEWKGYVPPYTPRFSDGWKPSVSHLDNIEGGTIGQGHPRRSSSIDRDEYDRRDEQRRSR